MVKWSITIQFSFEGGFQKIFYLKTKIQLKKIFKSGVESPLKADLIGNFMVKNKNFS